MTYYFARTVPGPFDDVVAATRKALAANGFGVITEIDVEATLQGKLGVEFRPYLILGACNPAMAHQALLIEDKVGTVLPCNVVVQALPGGGIEVAAIDPAASMQAIGNAALLKVASLIGEKLKAVIASL